MAGLYHDQGVVLRTYKLGEADRIVVVFTQGHGKVRAVAKGVRRTKSRFGGRLEPTAHAALQMYAGRELDTITQVETIEANRELREGYGLFTHASAMLEATDHLLPDREPSPVLYRMLSGALRTLAAQRNPLVTAAYFWKLLAHEGVEPILDRCPRCQTPAADAPIVAFDVSEGGGLCRACARGGGRPLSAPAADLLRAILGGRLNDALATLPGPATDEVERLGIATIEHHLERRLRSAHLL